MDAENISSYVKLNSKMADPILYKRNVFSCLYIFLAAVQEVTGLWNRCAFSVSKKHSRKGHQSISGARSRHVRRAVNIAGRTVLFRCLILTPLVLMVTVALRVMLEWTTFQCWVRNPERLLNSRGRRQAKFAIKRLRASTSRPCKCDQTYLSISLLSTDM